MPGPVEAAANADGTWAGDGVMVKAEQAWRKYRVFLTKYREEKKISKQFVAKHCQVTRCVVSQWESGITFPSAVRLGLWVDALGLQIAIIDPSPGRTA